jgi:hypothetical protein
MPTWSMVVNSSAGRPVRGSVVTTASSRTRRLRRQVTTGTRGPAPHVKSAAVDSGVSGAGPLQSQVSPPDLR